MAPSSRHPQRSAALSCRSAAFPAPAEKPYVQVARTSAFEVCILSVSVAQKPQTLVQHFMSSRTYFAPLFSPAASRHPLPASGGRGWGWG